MKHQYKIRIRYVYILFVFLFLILFLKISYLQIFRRDFLHGLAQGQHYRLVPLEGRRGRIIDSKGKELVRGISSYSIFADPANIDDVYQTAKILSENIGLSFQEIRKKLEKKSRFVWLKRKISWEEKEKIKAFDLAAVGFTREDKRFFPQEELASGVLGIVDIDNNGLSGIEFVYDSYLKGKDGLVRVLQDSHSRGIILSPQIVIPTAGADITCTIDAHIQYWVEQELKKTIEEFRAKEGSVIVMDASSGGILAMANYPAFNPNNLEERLADDMRNRAVTDMFEPGSVFKIVTLIGALAENKFSEEDRFFCEQGKMKIPGRYLNDWKPYGELSFVEVFKKSSNIGVAKIAQGIGKDNIYKYIKKLGFGQRTGIDLPGEISGSIKVPSEWSQNSVFVIPIGQEVGVSLIQLVRAFAVAANGGYLVKPYIVQEIFAPFFVKNTSVEKSRVISSDVAQRVKDIFLQVVEDGTAKRARIEGRKIGGKTGTAQKYDPKIKKYSPTDYRAGFVGFIADIEPPVVIGISIDRPEKSHFGGVVAAPLFRAIADRIIKYAEGGGDARDKE